MEGQPAIWVIASKCKTGERIREMLRDARLINPVKLIETAEELQRVLFPGCPAPQLILLDLGLEEELVWLAIDCLREEGLQSRVMVLVDGASERQLDRVYEAGIKTYLQEDFSFADFVERARVLGLQFEIARPDKT